MGHEEALLQRRATVAAIKEAEMLARASRNHSAFIKLIALFQQALEVYSVEELSAIEARANTYKRQLQNDPPQP